MILKCLEPIANKSSTSDLSDYLKFLVNNTSWLLLQVKSFITKKQTYVFTTCIVHDSEALKRKKLEARSMWQTTDILSRNECDLMLVDLANMTLLNEQLSGKIRKLTPQQTWNFQSDAYLSSFPFISSSKIKYYQEYFLVKISMFISLRLRK